MNSNDEFDEIFFSKHGVGQFAEDREYEMIAHTLDKTQPTLDEREFCRHIIKGDSNAEAYRKVFDKDQRLNPAHHSSYASSLLKRNRVGTYIYQLQKEVSELAEESLPTLIAELNEDRQLARDMGQPSAAISAVKAKASLLGLEDNKNVTTNINLTLSEEQKKALLTRIGGGISSLGGDTPIDAEFEDVSE